MLFVEFGHVGQASDSFHDLAEPRRHLPVALAVFRHYELNEKPTSLLNFRNQGPLPSFGQFLGVNPIASVVAEGTRSVVVGRHPAIGSGRLQRAVFQINQHHITGED